MAPPGRRAGHGAFLVAFQRWLEVNWSAALSSHEGGRQMREAGAKPGKVNITVGNTRTSWSCWELPVGFNALPSAHTRERAGRPIRGVNEKTRL